MRDGARARLPGTDGAHRVDLPHASADRAQRAGLLPHLRHGARTAHRLTRGTESRTGGHEPSILVEPRVHPAAVPAWHVGIPPRDAGAARTGPLAAVD